MSDALSSIDPAVNNLREYLETLFTADDELLQSLVRETYAKTEHPRMLGDRWLCTFMEWLIVTHSVQRILELGTFTGYTTLRLARALGDAGKITTIESSMQHADIAEKYFAKDGRTAQINLLRGTVREQLPNLVGCDYDLVYVDADKAEYPEYLRLLEPLLHVGSIIVADNVLWGGKTCSPSVQDARTNALRAFNQALFADPSYKTTLLPAGDGVIVATKITELDSV